MPTVDSIYEAMDAKTSGYGSSGLPHRTFRSEAAVYIKQGKDHPILFHRTQRVQVEVRVIFLNLDARQVWMVNVISRPLHPRENQITYIPKSKEKLEIV